MGRCAFSFELNFFRYLENAGPWATKYTKVYSSGYSLAHLLLRFDNYINSDLPQNVVDELTADLLWHGQQV
jgi:hypothetical protein